MAASFYFYDLETSGINARRDRVMQFAGQRTDMDLKPVGEPDNVLIKITPDILPDPYSVLVHGVSPQQTLIDGLSEAEFLKYLTSQVFVSDTIVVGFNNIRFDDDFMRFMLWRNFYDAYEWQWKDNNSRWDLLDLVRMTRALRPEGINWPFAPDGKPSNRLEYLSDVNKLTHVNPHDALSDVMASIDVAKLIKTKQPKLFDYLLNVRGKQKVAALVNQRQPFIYTSGRYPSEYAHTTVAIKLADHPGREAAIVYDLRVDPTPFVKMTSEKLAEAWQYRPPRPPAGGEPAVKRPYFPVKILVYNRCPAVAPLNVLDAHSAKRLSLSKADIDSNLKKLPEDFGDKLVRAQELMKKQEQPGLVVDPQKVDEQLYDSFVDGADKVKMRAVRAATVDKLADLQLDFNDERLTTLLPLYKARNYPSSLSAEEAVAWEKFRTQKLIGGGEKSLAADFFAKINDLSARPETTDAKKYLLEELRLYGESILPIEEV